MNSASDLDLIATGSAQKDVQANALFSAASPAMLFALRDVVALTWRFYGGMYNGAAIANGQLALAPSTTNYIQADVNGAVTVNAAGWTPASMRLYSVTTDANGAVAWTDYRQAIGAAGGASSPGKVLALVDATTINIDASANSKFKLTLAQDTAIANPKNLVDGQSIALLIKQDATGGHALSLGSAFQFSEGETPAWPTAAASMFLIRGHYDADSSTIICDVVLNVPAAPAVAGDPFAAAVVLDLEFTDFTDLTGKTVTESNVTLSNGAAVFDGSTSSMLVAASADFAFGTGPFTIDGFFDATDNGGAELRTFYCQRNGADHQLVIGLYQSQFFVYNGNAFIIQAGSPILNEREHWALVRDGDTLTFFQAGAVVASVNIAGQSLGSSTTGLKIGADTEYGQYFAGSIDALRITRAARYPGAAAFTPPTSF